MIVIDCEQGTPEWVNARLGVITASCFKSVLAQPRAKKDIDSGKLSETANSYLLELVAEVLTGEAKNISSYAMQWGTDHEHDARELYEFATGNVVEKVGLVLVNEFLSIGASPDGLVGDDGGIEIKCPFNTEVHLRTVISGDIPPEHVAQVQGCMWVTGRNWWDFVSYDPRIVDPKIGIFIKRIYRDEEYIAKLENKVLSFHRRLAETLDRLAAQ